VASVDLTCDGLTMQRVMLNSRDPELRDKHAGTANQGVQGFYRRVNALRLTTEFELGIDALFEDKSRAAVGRLSGTRSQLPPGPDHELQPLMITTLGRSGSTAIINLLSSHPQVVAYRPTETETRVASYWVDAFTQLTEPSSYLRQLFPNDLRRGSRHAPVARGDERGGACSRRAGTDRELLQAHRFARGPDGRHLLRREVPAARGPVRSRHARRALPAGT
jgi:hypothetical protein